MEGTKTVSNRSSAKYRISHFLEEFQSFSPTVYSDSIDVGLPYQCEILSAY